MISVEEALALIEQHARPLASRRVALGEAAGLVLAEDVTSDVDSPPFDKAMMDGYAVRSVDREPLRQVVEEVAAGAVPRRALTPGTASRVMTGAPLPEGADAVVPVELADMADDHTVRLEQTDPPPGQHVMPQGTALRAGSVALRAGAVLRPLEIAILAETGHNVVPVRPVPRTAVLATGNELVSVGERPSRGQIRDAGRPLVLASLRQLGAPAVDLGIARDDRDGLRRHVAEGLAADVLVISGGVSAGKYDLVPAVLAEAGVENVFHKVAVRPGKPLWFGIKSSNERQVLVFGLPGNPVSSFVCFELFVRPAVAALAGRGCFGASVTTASLSHAHDFGGGRTAFLPARITWPEAAGLSAGGGPTTGSLPTVEILPWRGSADLAALAGANGLARFSGEARRWDTGSLVEVLRV